MVKINIEELTIGQIREIQAMFPTSPQFFPPTISSVIDHPYQIGKCYLIRTVTMIDTGRLVAVTNQELVIEDAAWIADTGRFSDAVAKAEFGEVEPFPDGRVIIGRGAIIDVVEIDKTPRSQK